jgi:hypothetical protein
MASDRAGTPTAFVAEEQPAGGSAESANAGPLRAANSLQLAAAPAFAIMALLTAVGGDSPSSVLCGRPGSMSPLSGMVVMYLLMSVFHSARWLELIRRDSLGLRQKST